MSDKQLEQQILELEKEVNELENEIEKLDKEYSDNSHKLFHFNTQIDSLEKGIKAKKEQKTDKIKEQIEQDLVVLKKSQEQTSVKLRKTFQNYFIQQRTRMYLQANKSNAKIDVSSVAVFYLLNPHEYVIEQWNKDDTADFSEGFTIQYKCTTFLIRKNTTLEQIFNWSVQYWQLAKSEITMTDRNCNNLDLIMNYPIETFFSAHKEQISHACLFIYKKNLKTNFLLDQQKINIQLPGFKDNQTNQDDENIKQIKKELDEFVDVQPGLKLYENQNQDEEQAESGSISIGWKLFFLVLSATLLILNYINARGIMDYETTSQIRLTMHNYFLEIKKGLDSVSTIDDLYNKVNYITIVEREKNTDGTYEDVIQFQFIQMGPQIKLFQVQSDKYKCSTIETMSGYTSCSYSLYSDTNAIKSNISENYEWGKYKNAEQTGIYPFSGILSDYDGSGFEYSYDSYSYVDEIVDEQKQQNMLDIYDTKMVLFNIVIFDDSRDQFYILYLFYEIAPSYEIVQQLTILSFRCLTQQNSANFWLIEYVQIGISILLNFTLIFIGLKETWNKIQLQYKSFSLKRDLISFIQLDILFQLGIFILQIVSYTMFASIPSEPEQIMTDSDSQSIAEYASNFNDALVIRGILIILLGFNTLKLFQISESVAFVQAMATKGAENILMIIMFAIIILASYSFIFYQLFSEKFDEFTSYYRSFISTCGMFFLGNYKIWFKVVEYDLQSMIIITVFVFITYTYGATVLINAVLQEVYRTISYRTDHLKTINEFYSTLNNLKIKAIKLLKSMLNKIRRKND